MDDEMRTLGYLCPDCGRTVMAARSIFTLAASNAEVACTCGKSALTVKFDGIYYHIEAPCGLCGERHAARCTPERMLEGATALSCPNTQQFCGFIGSEGVVERQLRRLAYLAEKEKSQSDTLFSDNMIMYEILSELKDIAARPDGIVCACGSKAYSMEIRRSAVDLLCQNCGAKLRIPAVSSEDLDDLCCHMRLVIPGKQAETE